MNLRTHPPKNLKSVQYFSKLDKGEKSRFRQFLDSFLSSCKESENLRERAENLYLPLYFWCRELLTQQDSPHPLILGINGPQGVGKTTLTEALVKCFAIEGEKALALSIDDFYLTRQEQISLAAMNQNNRYLQLRGYPGTHDVELGSQVLKHLKSVENSGTVRLPRYDKSLFGGLGDRLPLSEWPEVRMPLRIVFLEGWMLGFRPVSSERIKEEGLKVINSLLAQYEKWHCQLDGFVQLSHSNFNQISLWRIQAEEKMKAQGKAGMSLAEIKGYIELFRPAYELYSDGLDTFGQEYLGCLRVNIGADRLPR
ncbi:MAG: hypothetical protein KDD35_09145 [Bdellovibrionales bacterium]|nr:hypothetical protein [Bdellovibrionales bacterium]